MAKIELMLIFSQTVNHFYFGNLFMQSPHAIEVRRISEEIKPIIECEERKFLVVLN